MVGLIPPLIIVAAAIAGVLTVRQLRARGAIRTRQGRCEACGASGPVIHVHFHQNTGMLIMRQYRSFETTACRGCATRLYLKTTVHNVFLGPWGMISFVLTPVFLLINTAQFIAVQTLPGSTVMARRALDEYREYAQNLLATKDLDTVIEVLGKVTGAPAGEVREYVNELSRSRAA